MVPPSHLGHWQWWGHWSGAGNDHTDICIMATIYCLLVQNTNNISCLLMWFDFHLFLNWVMNKINNNKYYLHRKPTWPSTTSLTIANFVDFQLSKLQSPLKPLLDTSVVIWLVDIYRYWHCVDIELWVVYLLCAGTCELCTMMWVVISLFTGISWDNNPDRDQESTNLPGSDQT